MSSHLPAGPRLGPGRWVAGKRNSVRTFKHRLKWRARRARWLSLLRQGRPRSRRPKGRHKRQEPLARLRSFQPSASCVSERRGSCKTSYFGRILSWLCGWLGIRVGEATNPGPKTNPQDGQLAQALLKVLHEFTHRTPKETKQAVDPGKKGKGGMRPKAARPSQPRLAHVLMQTLQAALTAGWSDETLAHRLINKINRHGSMDTSPNPLNTSDGSFSRSGQAMRKQALGHLLYPKIFQITPEYAGKVTGKILEQPNPEIQKLLHSEKLLHSQVHDVLNALGVPLNKAKTIPQSQPSWAEVARRGPSAGKGSTKGHAESLTNLGPRFAAHVQPSEWQGNPVVTTLPKVQKALCDGHDLPGNLIVTKDPQAADEATNMLHTFGCEDKSLTVAIADPPKASGPSVCVWWTASKPNKRHRKDRGSASFRLARVTAPR